MRQVFTTDFGDKRCCNEIICPDCHRVVYNSGCHLCSLFWDCSGGNLIDFCFLFFLFLCFFFLLKIFKTIGGLTDAFQCFVLPPLIYYKIFDKLVLPLRYKVFHLSIFVLGIVLIGYTAINAVDSILQAVNEYY